MKALRVIYGLLLLAIGLVLAGGGAWLIALGGSPYYLPAGIATGLSGLAVLRGNWWRGAAIFLCLIAVTTFWAIWESGLDPWALSPRVIAPSVMGLPFLVSALLNRGRRRQTGLVVTALAVVLIAVVGAQSRYQPAPDRPLGELVAASASDGDWPHFGNQVGGNHFSPLTQITPANVGKLQVAWSTLLGPAVPVKAGQNEATPLKIGDHLWTCLPLGYVYELDPETGKIRWSYDSKPTAEGLYKADCRGLAYYAVPGASGLCAQRIYTASSDARLIALDALTGKPCPGFGKDGAVDLLQGIRERQRGYYFPTSGPVIIRGKLVTNASVSDGQHVGEPSGVIRAFDAVTGKLAWAWDMGRPGQHGEPPAGEVYTPETPNSWGPMSADEDLGMVYVPTGNATPDYWGGHRSAVMNEFASSVVALNAETGEPVWHFQTTHYDLWDYDIASQPVLFTLRKDGVSTPALLMPTKRGQLFVFDRRNGKPLYPVVERPAPQTGGVEKLAPTQPWSPGMAELAIPRLAESHMWGITPLDQLWCRIAYRRSRYDGPFTPPGVVPSLQVPGNFGGVNWGSASIDEKRQLAFLLSNGMVNRPRLIPRSDPFAQSLKARPSSELGGPHPQEGTPFAAEAPPFLSPLYVPCNQPPWGKINAVDLATGKLVWSRPIGNGRDQGPLGMASHMPFTMGIFGFGGAMGTRSGLVFAGATQDHAFRAYNAATGELLFEADLPASAGATPMSYLSRSGKQFVAISSEDAGVHKDGYYARLTAFALPR